MATLQPQARNHRKRGDTSSAPSSPPAILERVSVSLERGQIATLRNVRRQYGVPQSALVRWMVRRLTRELAEHGADAVVASYRSQNPR